MGIGDIRALFGESDERSVSAEGFLLTLVRAVRTDGRGDGWRARDLYVAARKRRRRLAVLSIGTGPLAGMANQFADLYCETAAVCDVAALHRVDLSDEEVAAHVLVLWGLLEDHREALRVMAGDPPLIRVLAYRLRDRAGEQLPDGLTKRSIVRAMWDARGTIGAARKRTTTDTVTTMALTGHHTKKLIRRVEAQLGVAG